MDTSKYQWYHWITIWKGTNNFRAYSIFSSVDGRKPYDNPITCMYVLKIMVCFQILLLLHAKILIWLIIWITTIFNCFESHTMTWAFSRIANWRSQTAHTKGASLAFPIMSMTIALTSVFFCFEWFGTVKYNHAILIICIQTLSQLRSVFTLIQCSLHTCLGSP